MPSQASVFPCGNGDSVLIESGDAVILTDINYRSDCQDPDKGLYDFADDLRQACKQAKGGYSLDVFISTHPDRDHLTGADTLLHLGKPSAYEAKPKEGDPKILIKELWVSPYSLDPAYETDQSAPLLKEIRRRKALEGTADASLDGNRLKVLTADGEENSGQVGKYLDWLLLAPTAKEADISQPGDDEEKVSCNDSSLVILWTLRLGSQEARFLLTGDAGVDVWERIHKDYKKNLDDIGRHVLVSPHHCSRTAMARKVDDEYEYSANALAALGVMIGDGFVVASAKEVKKNDDNPPSWEAKQRYLGILKNANATSYEDRFLNPDTHKEGKPAPVVFTLTANGLVCNVPEKVKKHEHARGLGVSKPGSYGLRK